MSRKAFKIREIIPSNVEDDEPAPIAHFLNEISPFHEKMSQISEIQTTLSERLDAISIDMS